MINVQQDVQTRITSGKSKGLSAIADEHGIITSVATDQRGSLKKTLAAASGRDVSAASLTEIKKCFVEALGPHASALLIDPEYGLSTIALRSPQTGVFLAYERTGFDPQIKGRLPELLSEWSVYRLVERGANGIKILLYYDSDDNSTINEVKHSFIERVGAECRAYDVPFFLEPVSYSDARPNENSLAFAQIKPDKVKQSIQEFSKPQYGVDVLMVELPVDVRYVEALQVNTTGEHAYNYAEAIKHLREAATVAQVPFIYLSASATAPIFAETLGLITEAGTGFSGVLYGLDIWRDSIVAYAQGGSAGLYDWLEQHTVPILQEFNQTIKQYGRPWWDVYGS
ncbi:tagatose 1,6-diphosphate aldolase [Brasilonema sp. UFV-L1]|uniref:tagatose 1,6-diphosphate aldolase n=1 Tax=Brasilonema sp. UFV-L1 TaxID=2234130 RepID=UPI00145F755B|nr:tagatose 1,6-diphosphate aldolase [Brasilonema sp. UFV-L1]NMG10398.1 tagatose 1,6-diphosphate aldolase [Brasilonema sp. UFV-L1]